VKALGLWLAHRGVAQVSMNLTDHSVTSMHEVFDRIRAEAARHGVEILDTEIVGLVPAAALESAAAWYLKISGFDRRQVLERRIDECRPRP
jgi:glutamate formiminotransferase